MLICFMWNPWTNYQLLVYWSPCFCMVQFIRDSSFM